jgi:hypothetical protein
MLYDMYVLQPNTIKRFEMPRIEYWHDWMPIFNITPPNNSFF